MIQALAIVTKKSPGAGYFCNTGSLVIGKHLDSVFVQRRCVMFQSHALSFSVILDANKPITLEKQSKITCISTSFLTSIGNFCNCLSFEKQNFASEKWQKARSCFAPLSEKEWPRSPILLGALSYQFEQIWTQDLVFQYKVLFQDIFTHHFVNEKSQQSLVVLFRCFQLRN